MERWFKSQPLSLQAKNVNRKEGIIYDVVMCEAGPAKGHGVHLEESFITALVAYDRDHFRKSGVKARFGHPAMSDSTMGTQMGYFKNVRQDGIRAIGDLHLLSAADHSPSKPNMREWMLDMAEEAKDFVMSSIVFKPSGYYQYNPENNEIVSFDQAHEAPFSDKKIYVDFNSAKGARHNYTDIVEAGAATNALFSQQFNKDKFAIRTVAWLQENSDILQFIRSNPHKIIEMCETLQIPINKEMSTKPTNEGFFQHMRSFFYPDHTDEATENDVEASEPVVEDVEPTQEALTSDENDQEFFLSQIEERLAVLEEANTALRSENEQLKAKHRAEPTGINTEPKTADPRERYLCDTTLKAGQR